MTSPFAEQIEQAMTRLREQQEKMESIREELQASSVTVTSKDRMVTAKVGPQGQVLSLTFNTTSYRDMAPSQLGSVLTDVLNEARAKMGEEISKQMKSFEGLGEMLRSSMVGGSDLDELLKPLRAMKPDYAAEERRNLKKQEEFNG
ncbi:YbaB/EbfC family nucleoid-associated protein [Streptomyces sp. NPDC005122]